MSRNIRPTALLRLESLEQREVPAIVFALTNSQRIQTFDTGNPGLLLGSVGVTGLAEPGERLTDIDVRAANGGLYGRSSLNRVYLLNPQTGVAAQVGGTIVGAQVGMAFDPVKDQLRAVNFSGGNIALTASTGVLAATGATPTYVSGDVFGGTQARLSSLAFTNNTLLPLTTQLFGIDHVNDTLVRGIGDPNTGQFQTVAGFGFDITSNVGLDIDPAGNVGYIAIQPAGEPGSLFGRIDLNNGALSLFGPVGRVGPVILDVAVANRFGALGTGSAEPFLAPPQPIDGPTTTLPDNPVGIPLGPDVPTQSPFPGTGTTFFPTTSPFFPATGTFIPTMGLAGVGSSLSSTGLVQPLGPGIMSSSLSSFGSPLAPGVIGTSTFNSPLVAVPPVSSIDSFNSFDTFNSF